MPTDPLALGPQDASDAAFLAWLRDLFDADGTLRVRRLVVVDEGGQPCILLQRVAYRSEVVVQLPSLPGDSSTAVNLFAENGHPGDPSIDPAIGAAMVVEGNEAATVNVVPDRWGGWTFHVSAEADAVVRNRPH
jgi:hypothetical protein